MSSRGRDEDFLRTRAVALPLVGELKASEIQRNADAIGIVENELRIAGARHDGVEPAGVLSAQV